MVYMPSIIDESYSSHDKEKEQCFLVCIVLNLGVSKLASLSVVANSFVVLHACMALHLSTVAFAIWSLEYGIN